MHPDCSHTAAKHIMQFCISDSCLGAIRSTSARGLLSHILMHFFQIQCFEIFYPGLIKGRQRGLDKSDWINMIPRSAKMVLYVCKVPTHDAAQLDGFMLLGSFSRVRMSLCNHPACKIGSECLREDLQHCVPSDLLRPGWC